MSAQSFLGGRVTLHAGDSRDVLASLPDASIDSIVTDPPYALVSIGKRFGKPDSAVITVPDGKSGAYARAAAGFMGKQWDTGETAFAVAFWAQCLRVLKPGGHVVAFGGTRSYHRLACAIEDAGFEIRDQLAWCYGTGFPKSHDVAKGIDRAAGVEREVVGVSARRVDPLGSRSVSGLSGSSTFRENPANPGNLLTAPATDAAREWQGWGTALKPAWEPIALARKTLDGTVAETVLAHGTGALNIDGCRIPMVDSDAAKIAGRVFVGSPPSSSIGSFASEGADKVMIAHPDCRWPANIIHDGSDEVVATFPTTSPSTIGKLRGAASGAGWGMTQTGAEYADSGSAARFFYSAKADADDRLGSKHPTVKPVDLMQWLCRLVTPPGGVVLDPFAGTGSTGEAAWREGFAAVLIEREAEYQADIARRMGLCLAGPGERRREASKAKHAGKPVDHGPLFGDPGLSGGGVRSTGPSPIRTVDRTDRNEKVIT